MRLTVCIAACNCYRPGMNPVQRQLSLDAMLVQTRRMVAASRKAVAASRASIADSALRTASGESRCLPCFPPASDDDLRVAGLTAMVRAESDQSIIDGEIRLTLARFDVDGEQSA